MSTLRFASALFTLALATTWPVAAGAQSPSASKQLRFEALDAASVISAELNRVRPTVSDNASELKSTEIRRRSAKVNGMLFHLASARTTQTADIEKARYLLQEVIAELERIRHRATEGPGRVDVNQDAIEASLLGLIQAFENEEKAVLREP